MVSSRDILIIEDDTDSRETLSDILEMEGFRVSGAANGNEALRQLEHQPYPNLILLDLMMPVMDGWEFRRRQKQDKKLAEIPVIVLSGDGNIEQRAASVDAADYLMKPIDLGKLLALIDRHLH